MKTHSTDVITARTDSGRCYVYGCLGHRVARMEWRSREGEHMLLLCAEHEDFYRNISGPHVVFTSLDEPGTL